MATDLKAAVGFAATNISALELSTFMCNAEGRSIACPEFSLSLH